MGRAIVNAQNGKGWYPKGQQRLKDSIVKENICFYSDYPNTFFKGTNNYYLKPSALYEASKTFNQLLWMDSSCWVIKDLQPIWDLIQKQGYYFIHSGFNCAQYCNDAILDYYHITRDEAEKIPMIYAICFGINRNHKIGLEIFDSFLIAAEDRQFDDGNGSKDPRFIAHRHDQSALSLIAYKLNCTIHNVNLYNSTNVTNPNKSVCVLMQGM